MNKQLKTKNGNVLSRGIEWTDYTWNVVGGCQHACRWRMPDGTLAICYAETTANVFTSAYPHGFEHHYWRPHKLKEPLRMKKGVKIFMDSMSDLMGRWVADDQINQVLNIVRQSPQHTFQLLTKNAPRLLKFDFPDNVWVGASSPPDFMFDKPLDHNQQAKMLTKTLQTLAQVNAPVRWMSIEPLSWDVSEIIAANAPLQWAVIGAATNGRAVYQPESHHVRSLLTVLDHQKTPVFFKGNLKGNDGIDSWREFYPSFEPKGAINNGH